MDAIRCLVVLMLMVVVGAAAAVSAVHDHPAPSFDFPYTKFQVVSKKNVPAPPAPTRTFYHWSTPPSYKYKSPPPQIPLLRRPSPRPPPLQPPPTY